MHISTSVPEGVLYTIGMSMLSSVSGLHPICTMCTVPNHKVPAYAHWPERPPLVWLVHSLCAHHLPSTSSNIPHCTCTSTHTPSPAALPHLDVPIHPCFPLPGGLLPQTSPSGTNYPMVGVLSMCPPHHFSQFPTSGHPCRPAQTCFFAYLALHGLCTTLHTLPCTSAHLHAPLHTSAHLCTPFRIPLCTSMHLH